MLLRSSLSWATVRPRYSVSRTAVESSKCFVSSATDASFCAMATPCVYETLHDGGAPARGIRSSDLTRQQKSSGASARSRILNPGRSFVTPARAPALQSFDLHALARTSMTGGLRLIQGY